VSRSRDSFSTAHLRRRLDHSYITGNAAIVQALNLLKK